MTTADELKNAMLEEHERTHTPRVFTRIDFDGTTELDQATVMAVLKDGKFTVKLGDGPVVLEAVRCSSDGKLYGYAVGEGARKLEREGGGVGIRVNLATARLDGEAGAHSTENAAPPIDLKTLRNARANLLLGFCLMACGLLYTLLARCR